MDKIFFSIGVLHFYRFGTILAAGAALALAVTIWRAQRLKLSGSLAARIFIAAVLAAIVGSRLLFVVLQLPLFVQTPLSALMLWQGGFSAAGAFAGALLGAILYLRYCEADVWRWLDIFVPGTILGQLIAQFAYIAGQADFGRPVAGSNWGLYIDFACRPAAYRQYDFFAPAPLYQAGWIAAVFILLLAYEYMAAGRQWPRGNVFLIYAVLYNVGAVIADGTAMTAGTGIVLVSQAIAAVIAATALFLLYRRCHDECGFKYRREAR